MIGIVECPKCSKVYDNKKRIPKILSCGHTMCLQCLESIIKVDQVECMKCKTWTVVSKCDVNRLMTNLTTLESLQSTCLECKAHVATATCGHCDMSICEFCHKLHMNLKLKQLSDLLTNAKAKIQLVLNECNKTSTSPKFRYMSEVTISQVKQFWDDLIIKVQEYKDKSINNVVEKMESTIRASLAYQQELKIMLAKYTSKIEKTQTEICNVQNKLSEKNMDEIMKELEEMMMKFDTHSLEKVWSLPKLGLPMDDWEKYLTEAADTLLKSVNETVKVYEGGFNMSPKFKLLRPDNEYLKMKPRKVASGGTGRQPTYLDVLSGEPTESDQQYETVMGTAAKPSYYENIHISTSYGCHGASAGEFDWPCNVAMSPVSGHIFVSDLNNHRVHELSSDLKLVSMIDFSAKTPFLYPTGLAFTSNETLFTSHKRGHSIQMRSNGLLLHKFGNLGAGQNEFNCPAGITTDAEDYVYVCDRKNKRVQIFNPSGIYISTFGHRFMPNFIAVSDELAVVSSDNGHLYIFTSMGNYTRTIESGQTGSFTKATGVAIDRLKNIVVADEQGRLLVLTQDGEVIHTIGCPGDGPGQLKMPQGIALTPKGSIIVCDSGNQRVQMFKSYGPSV